MFHRVSMAMLALSAAAMAASSPSVTFHKDVLPVLQSHCQTCRTVGADVVSELREYASLGPGNQRSCRPAQDAAMVC